MDFYSIGEVANLVGVPTSTLRYYDREGLFLNVKRSHGGIRVFTDAEVETLKVIECLKSTGMQIKDIKLFLDWCLEGEKSLQKRLEMFFERKAIVEKQMEDIQKTMEMVNYKIWYYETALKAGSEDVPKNMPFDDLPNEVKKWKMTLNKSLSHSGNDY